MQGQICNGGGPIGPNGGLCSIQIPPEFWMYDYKVLMCPRHDTHEWERCPYAHPGEKARRRHPSKYKSKHCGYTRAKKVCPAGEDCTSAHSLFEYWLHPTRFRTCFCSKGAACDRPMCFFAHSALDLRIVPAASDASGSETPPTLSQVGSVEGAGLEGGNTQQAAAHALWGQQLSPRRLSMTEGDMSLPQQQQQQQQQLLSSSPGKRPLSAEVGAIDALLASVNLIATGNAGGGEEGRSRRASSSSMLSTPRSLSPALQPLSPGTFLAAAAANGYIVSGPSGSPRAPTPGMDSEGVLVSLSSWQRSQVGAIGPFVGAGSSMQQHTAAFAAAAAADGAGSSRPRLPRSNSWVDEHAAAREHQQHEQDQEVSLVGLAAAQGTPTGSGQASPPGQTEGLYSQGLAVRPLMMQQGSAAGGWRSPQRQQMTSLSLAPAAAIGTTDASAAGLLGGSWGTGGGIPLSSDYATSPTSSPLQALAGGGTCGADWSSPPTSMLSSIPPLGGSGSATAGDPLAQAGAAGAGRMRSPVSPTIAGAGPLSGGGGGAPAISGRAQAAVATLMAQLDQQELTEVVGMLQRLLGM